MSLFTQPQRDFAEAVSEFAFANPFQPDETSRLLRQMLERSGPIAISTSNPERLIVPGNDELGKSLSIAANMLNNLTSSLRSGSKLSDKDHWLYQDLILVVLYYRFRDRFLNTIEQALHSHEVTQTNRSSVDYYLDFEKQWQFFWNDTGIQNDAHYSCHHTFACLFQIRRAHFCINQFIWGNASLIQQLRASIWQSIFTHDFRRYGLLLYDRMEEITTLISGPSGTGKELVARAIGLSRHIPFDSRHRRFREDFSEGFHVSNISAFAETLVESDLFGHAKGAFTGAVAARTGLFESCKPGHSVFLDEIGELSASLQVKLLRVLQNREFQRLGETQVRRFGGKLIVATNRDFSSELAAGRFREDLYYRLCSDVITTPSLIEQIRDEPAQLLPLVRQIARRLLPDSDAADEVTSDTIRWITHQLGPDYQWPGNFRELEQCVRNILIRKVYRPLQPASHSTTDLVDSFRNGDVTAEELVSLYCASVFEKNRSYAATARVVGLDQRTVKKHIETLRNSQ
ncbi:MAG: sigma 54-interacting transcriptional regulator [Planctomyces sp.]|nr:sigma 54-interacting transcriptional regulator [Planctomyces sp.]